MGFTSAIYRSTVDWCEARRPGGPLGRAGESRLSQSLKTTRRILATDLPSIQSLGRRGGAVSSHQALEDRAARSANPVLRASSHLRQSLASQASAPGADKPAVIEQGQLCEPLLGAGEDRYQILHAIRGGMGVVTICFDHAHDFPFAIKTFREECFRSNPRLLTCFFREVEIWTRLGGHPNIVRAYGTRLVDQRPYLILEFVPGETCRELLRAGPLRPTDVRDAGVMVCDALLHARRRARGFVHGDLKLSNLLVYQGQVRVTDFGLASASHIGDGRASGTPVCMAPEQWRAGQVSEKTDVYALGVALCQLATGSPPFPSRRLRTLRRAHLYQVPRWLKMCAGHWGLGELLLRCLEKSPAARPSLRELRDGLFQLSPSGRGNAGARQAAGPGLQRRIGRRDLRAQVRMRVASFVTSLATARKVRGALAFGETYEGGPDAAIENQLQRLDTRLMPPCQVLQRLSSLSRLKDAHPRAFASFSAERFDFGPLSLRRRDLGGLCLPNGRLTRLDLRDANLGAADLRGACFEDSLLHYASLRGADLRGADLRGADLRRTDLRGCRLEGARLQGVDLRGCALKGARLLGAHIDFRTRLDATALPGLWSTLLHGQTDERRQVVAMILAVGCDAHGLEALQEGLQDQDLGVRLSCAAALGRLGEASCQAAPRLLDIVACPEAPAELRQQAIQSLGSMVEVGEAGVWILIRCLKEQDGALKGVAARTLGRVRPRTNELVRALGQMLEEPGTVGVWAARSLGRMGAEAGPAIWDLGFALENGGGKLRVEACRAIGRLGPTAGVLEPILERCLRDRLRSVREAAEAALLRVSPERASDRAPSRAAGRWPDRRSP